VVKKKKKKNLDNIFIRSNLKVDLDKKLGIELYTWKWINLN